MAVLNPDSYYRLVTSPEPVGNTFWAPPQCIRAPGNVILFLRDFNDKDYWYIDIFQGNSFESYPVETIIPLPILRKIWNKEIFLLISNSHEAFLSIVEGLYKSLIIRGNIDPEQIILLSESPDIINEVKIVSEKYNVGHIKVEWMREFEYNAKVQRIELTCEQLKSPPVTLVDKKYEKKFLSFNRNMTSREHRASILALLCSMNVLDQGYISIGSSDVIPDWNILFWVVKEIHKNDTEILKLLEDNSEKIKNIGRIVLDAPYKDLVAELTYINPNTDYLYTDTYFSVITETTGLARGPHGGHWGPGRLLSEKTFKPIAYSHPFIIVARPYTLTLLKELGYKTFSPYIDESYDTVTDDATRMVMISKEIKRLCELSPSELTEFLNNVREICKFNYEKLLFKSNYTTKLN